MTKRDPTAKGAIQFQLLGGFTVRAGDRTIAPEAWRLSKARSLVKLLALAPGQRLGRDRVLDALWPDFTPETAQNNLYTTLAATRRVLEPEATVRLRDGVLALETTLPLTVDVAVFEEAARRAVHSRDPGDYVAALAHYGGDLLPGDLYEDWVAARREPLRATYRQLLFALASLQQERGASDAALATLQRLIAEDPLHEEANMALMRLYAARGQRTLAIRQYQTLRTALADQLDAEPSSAVRRLYADIATGRAETERRAREVPSPGEAERPRPARHNLPAALTSFVGREQEVATVAGLLTGSPAAPVPRPRLVTLLGIGGTGKTRLALAVARETLDAYPEGVWFVDLAPLRDPALVLTTTATVLGVREGGRASATRRADRRAPRAGDIGGAGSASTSSRRCRSFAGGAAARLRQPPDLATSRERLHVAGETAWPVPPLAAPSPQLHDGDPAALAQVPSVRLFLDRVRQHRPNLTLTGENVQAVAAICRRLDGLPLALELAAARARRSCRSINSPPAWECPRAAGCARTGPTRAPANAARDDRLELLAALTPDEQQLLAQLAVFEGGCTLAAIEAVADADALLVLDSLSALDDHSLLHRYDTAVGEPRFRMLELVREYASEQLAARGEEPTVRTRHADYFLGLAEAESSMEQIAWQRMVLAEEDNLRAALRWSIAEAERHIALRLGNALVSFWTTRGAFREGRGWLDAMLEISPPIPPHGCTAKPAPRAGALRRGRARLAERRGRGCPTVWRASPGRIPRILDDQRAIAGTLRLLANIALIAGQNDLVRALLDEAENLLRALGDHRDLAMVLNTRGELVRSVDNDYRLAEKHYREALALTRADGTAHWVATLLGNIAIVALRRGGSNEALRLLHEGLELRLELRHQRGIAICLELSGAVAVTLGRFAQAARFYGAAEQLRRVINSPRTSDPADEAEHQHYLALARNRADPAAWASDWATGAAIPLDQVLTEALVMSGTPVQAD
ncbi:MAG: BTAD domain-containing putative transcriptional regulator [Chloroflexia bacterium]